MSEGEFHSYVGFAFGQFCASSFETKSQVTWFYSSLDVFGHNVVKVYIVEFSTRYKCLIWAVDSLLLHPKSLDEFFYLIMGLQYPIFLYVTTSFSDQYHRMEPAFLASV